MSNDVWQCVATWKKADEGSDNDFKEIIMFLEYFF